MQIGIRIGLNIAAVDRGPAVDGFGSVIQLQLEHSHVRLAVNENMAIEAINADCIPGFNAVDGIFEPVVTADPELRAVEQKAGAAIPAGFLVVQGSEALQDMKSRFRRKVQLQ